MKTIKEIKEDLLKLLKDKFKTKKDVMDFIWFFKKNRYNIYKYILYLFF